MSEENTMKTELFTTDKGELFKLRVRDWFLNKAGWILEKLHVSARIREFEHVDPITNETIYLSTGTRYSVLHVGDKHFFFDRLTGRFDGTGTSLSDLQCEPFPNS